MEGLVIIVAELLFALLGPLFAALGGLAALLLDLLVALLGALLSGRRRRPEPEAPSPSRPVRVPRAWLHAAAGLGVLVIAGVLVVNALFLAPALRWVLARVEDRTGYAVAFEAAEGNLLSGRLALTGLDVTRNADEGLMLDLAVERARLDVRMTSLLGSEIALESLEIAGVTGRLEPRPRPETGAAAAGAPRPRRAFTVERAALSAIDVEVAPPGRPPHRLEIALATAEPFRSRSALFDLFFRSTLDARIDGIPLRVETEAISERGRRTAWAFEEVPVATLAALTARAPVSWLSGGTVTAQVEDEWDLTETRIDMDWRLVLDRVQAAPPAGAGAAEAVLARALGAALDRAGGSGDFAVTLALDRERLEVVGSDDLGALWEALRDGLAASLTSRTGEAAAEAAGRIESARERLLDLVRPPGEEPASAAPGAAP
ncbi:MAG: hypothetical protein OEM24_12580 [Paracoccaceae bacterium]|nr:hypothetical protein [Paracoccaceae bacterium]